MPPESDASTASPSADLQANVLLVELELKPGVHLYHAKLFSVSKSLEHLLKEECCKFKELGIWHHDMNLEWAGGMFPSPKKTGTTDFWELNKWLVCKPYPLPKIQCFLQKLKKFKYATALDLQHGYCSIPLSEKVKWLCATVFPWSKYIYNILPTQYRIG